MAYYNSPLAGPNPPTQQTPPRPPNITTTPDFFQTFGGFDGGLKNGFLAATLSSSRAQNQYQAQVDGAAERLRARLEAMGAGMRQQATDQAISRGLGFSGIRDASIDSVNQGIVNAYGQGLTDIEQYYAGLNENAANRASQEAIANSRNQTESWLGSQNAQLQKWLGDLNAMVAREKMDNDLKISQTSFLDQLMARLLA